MNELKIFENALFGQVRVVEQNGEPWFVAADVCRALEIMTEQTRRLDEDEKGLRSLQTPGGMQEMTIVNEPGLYSLVLGSRKPEAKQFKRWITHEVLPSIRKHGGYIAGQEQMTDEELVAKALLVANSKMQELQNRLNQQDVQINHLTVQTEVMRPKADYFDALVDRGTNISFRETAKQLGVKEREFIAFLLAHKYVYRDQKGKLTPYAQYASDLFTIKESFNEKTNWAGTQTLTTPKGRETFRLLMTGLRFESSVIS